MSWAEVTQEYVKARNMDWLNTKWDGDESSDCVVWNVTKTNKK